MAPTSTNENQASIPIVDFAKFLNGGEEDKIQTAREIDDAFQNAGFVYLKGHGVDNEVVAEAFKWSAKFFALPLSTKLLAPHPPGHTHHRGYSSPGLEKVANLSPKNPSSSKLATDDGSEEQQQRLDCKESYEIGNLTDTTQPNIWLPDDKLPGFRPFMESFFTICATLVHKILDALSLALHVPAPGLSPTHSDSLFQLRLLHYPPIAASELLDNKRSRINAHADFGTITLLFQDSVGGLEVEDPGQQGVFRPVEPVHGTVLVNMGELMTRWSNGRWRSTVHRVGLPRERSEPSNEQCELSNEQSEPSNKQSNLVPPRYSLPFFAITNMNQIIDALPGCWDKKQNPKKFAAVTAWDYMMGRMAEIYD